jgi:peroxiredoxin Q/BCP
MSIKIGEVIPDFRLPASNGKEVSITDFRGKMVVIYFYPKDMTPGCTTEACDFRDFYGKFSEHQVEVIGISPDPLKSHSKFIDTHELPFLLLSDEEHKVAELFGVWKLKKNFGKEYMGIERSTFLIDENGRLLHEWRNVKVDGHVDSVYSHILMHFRGNN